REERGGDREGSRAPQHARRDSQGGRAMGEFLRTETQQLFRHLLHDYRIARRARARRRHRLRVFLYYWQSALPAQSGATRQPRRGLRLVLAFCGPHLDFRLSAVLFAVSHERIASPPPPKPPPPCVL